MMHVSSASSAEIFNTHLSLFQMKYIPSILLFAFATLTSSYADSQLYAATGFANSAGELYILDPADGSVIEDVGPLNDSDGNNYSLTGLRFDESTGLLFGITGSSPTSPTSLVLVNPNNARVSYVGGPFSSRLSDIAIDPVTDLMYAVSGSSKYFYLVEKLTGTDTRIGDTDVPPKRGGGLAANSRGVVYGTNDGTLVTYNKITGEASAVGDTNLSFFVGALAFSPSNVLYGVEGGGATTDDGSATDDEASTSNRERWLVVLNTTTGAAVEVGSTVGDLNALAFIPTP